LALTVKDFSKVLKISESALLERMQNAGLSHKSASDEITPADKSALLRSLKNRKSQTPPTSPDSGIKVVSKGKTIAEGDAPKSYSDNIEAKRAAASEQLKEQQKKREDQIKESARLKKEEREKQLVARKEAPVQPKVNIKDQLSRASKEYSRKELRGARNTDAEHQFEAPTKAKAKTVDVPETIQVGELAKLIAVKGGLVVKELMSLGVAATINDAIDQETAILVLEEMGHIGNPLKSDNVEEEIASLITYSDEMKTRAPVVTVMGHVDHGKTTLLDFIRESKVVDGEAGGITQHIGAYQVDTSKGLITFIDTPGHAAFSSMRARGANTTDIVILVVAANDGIMPQTEEAINHAKAAGVSIVVAINKIDLPDTDIEKVKGDLAGKDLIPEDWGGTIQMVPVSAITGEGVDKLLESVYLESELLELKSHFDGPAQGAVIESELDKFRGPVSTFLVQNGTLKLGDIVASGNAVGKIKSIINSDGKKLKTAGPSFAVEVLGLNSVPSAGDQFQVVDSDKKAREIAEFRVNKEKERKQLKQRDAGLNIFETMGQESKKILNVIVKTDVVGTSEAIINALHDLGTDLAKVKIVSSGVGGISESDANLALAVNSIILGFNVRADNAAKKIIEEESIDLTYHSIIYELLDDIKAKLSGLLDPIIREEIVGTAEVLEVFSSPKFGQIAGSMVLEGSVFRNKPVRVLRDEIVIFEGELDSLRRFKDDIAEVKNGTECGIGIKNYKDIKAGDKIEVFDRKVEAQTL
jgi:translation initiation factor IF-2|tara:strand:+ start:2611 stop:4878 length:2268 start_codon:yes stop_codon:yes gene_type:complete